MDLQVNHKYMVRSLIQTSLLTLQVVLLRIDACWNLELDDGRWINWFAILILCQEMLVSWQLKICTYLSLFQRRLGQPQVAVASQAYNLHCEG